ncbi:glycerol-3-phosphate dehydrogenase (NAD+) [Nematocida minor]|uniref:glycerol-3-phosphate dehydrogenase (NAD+) n=1 Tax=Nematocida minor TaxID=1912983 RepID=UPI0022201989|nr:glycerol-3-phosphate dehydrogenase (NAD+) [Nematocida minor]KAI5191084.1 glycerol-3-phosphate dehydrogenase (NAD+) [Nematocida minor]
MDKDVAVIGGGSWGTTIAKLIAENKQKKGENGAVRMWIYEETVNGKKLTSIINDEHENVKYLPEVKLPSNLVAYPEIKQAIEGVDVIALAVPHEFLDGILQQIKRNISDKAILVILTKGFFFRKDKIELISQSIKNYMNVRVCTLMGANIAGDVASGKLSECTLGYQDEGAIDEVLAVFSSENFKVSPVLDYGSVEVCGTLKNVVAVGYGIVSGHGHGVNTLAAVIRNGLLEIVRFCDEFIAQNSTSAAIPVVFFESCGLADLIVTCTSGRNYKYSKMAAEKKISIPTVEKEEMNGQKLQGYSTIKELIVFMESKKIEKKYPFLYAIGTSATTDMSADRILKVIQEK